MFTRFVCSKLKNFMKVCFIQVPPVLMLHSDYLIIRYGYVNKMARIWSLFTCVVNDAL